VLVYNTAPARDGRLKAVNLRSLSSHCRRQLFANAAMAASQMKLPAPSTPLSPSRH
jgi:hypothetical protein